MKVLIEAIGIEKAGGVRSATINLLDQIFSIDHNNDYTVILSKHEDSLNRFTNVHQVVIPVRNRFLDRIWAQLAIPLKFRNFDVIHFTKNLGVFGTKVPSIITIHDLTTVVHPEFFPWIDVLYWKTLERRTVKTAKIIIAVSKNTADDVEKFFNKDPRQIKVIYHGRSNLFAPSKYDDIIRIKNKYSLPAKYLIAVGRIDLKKNLTNLVKAFAMVQGQIDPKIKLILVGEVYKKCEDKNLLPTIQSLGLQDQVIFTGRVPDEDLPGLYSGAILCAFPSVHEGFGLVGLEAMACGVPVITHNSSAIVEVVDNAGLKIDATKVPELADALLRVINDLPLREQMRVRGMERSKEFTWKKAAQQTIDAYRQVCNR